MTPDQYRAIRERLTLDHDGIALLLGCAARTSRRYEDGTRGIPEATQRLLWAIQRDPGLPAELAQLPVSCP